MPWRWRQHDFPKVCYLHTNPHCVTYQKTKWTFTVLELNFGIRFEVMYEEGICVNIDSAVGDTCGIVWSLGANRAFALGPRRVAGSLDSSCRYYSHVQINFLHFYSKTNEMHQFLKFISFYSSTVHVSNGLSVHHQESKTVHTASGLCQTDFAVCLLAGTRLNESSISFPLASSQQKLFDIYLILYLQS